MLIFQVCHFLALPWSQIENMHLTITKTLLNSHMYYILIASRKWPNWLYLYLVVDVHASCNCVILWSVWKLFNCTMYIKLVWECWESQDSSELVLLRVQNTGWHTKCHTIDCARNKYLLIQKHLTPGTELILIGWKIVPNEEHVQCDHRFASQLLANEPLHSSQLFDTSLQKARGTTSLCGPWAACS